MRQQNLKLIGICTVLLFTMLACSFGGRTDDITNLKSTIESLQSTIGPEIQGQVETLLPESTLPADLSLPSGVNPQMLKLLGQHGGSSRAIAVKDGIAYTGQGPRLLALDVSKAADIQVIGQSEVLPGIVEGVELADGYAYVVTKYGGLYIFDIHNPQKIDQVGTYLPGIPGCDAMALQGHFAYLACNSGGLYKIDVADPHNPKEAGHSSETGAMISIAVSGDYGYVVDVSRQALVTYNISGTSNLQKTAQFMVTDVPGDAKESYSFESVKICGKYLCLAGGQSGLVILRLTNPAQPVFAGRYDSQVASGLTPVDNLVYLVDDMDGVHVLDITDPEKIAEVGSMPTSVGGWELSLVEMYERGVFAVSNLLYITDPVYGITIIDITNPGALKRVGHYQTPAPDVLQQIQVKDDYAYLIGRFSGFRVLNISKPNELDEVYYDEKRKNLNLQVPTGLELAGDHAYISDSNYPFHLYDISNPQKPVQTGAVFDEHASSGAFDIAISGNYAYLSGWGLSDAFYPGQGLWVIDISNPNNPKAVQFVDVQNERWHLSIKDQVLFALDGGVDEKDRDDLSLRVFDISDATKPVEVKKLPVQAMPMMPSDMVAAGDHLYISLSAQGIQDFDISNPLQPVQLGILAGGYPTASSNLEWSDPYLIAGGMYAYNLSDPTKLEQAGMAYLPAAWAGRVEGGRLYVVTAFQGLYIYEMPK